MHPPTRHRRPSLFTPVALAATLLAAGCASAPTPSAPGPAGTGPITLRVVAINDYHGHLEAGSLSLTLPDPRQAGATLRVPAGGAAALAGLLGALRADTADSVFVSSGDLVGAAPLVSSLFRHESTIEVMNRIGLDVATVGNHEFDAGVAELQRLLQGGCAATRPDDPGQSCALRPDYGGARFPVVAANVQTPSGPLLAPAWVREVGGVKVGFIGAVTRSTPGIVMPSGVAGLRFEDEAEAINRAADALQARGVKALVAVIHEGGEIPAPAAGVADWNDPACPGLRGEIVDMAHRLSPQIDLVLTAHTHQGYNCRLDGRPVMQATSYGRGVSVADLVLDPATGDFDRARTLTRNLPVLTEQADPAAREALAAALPAPLGDALRRAQPDTAVAQTVAAYARAAAPRVQRAVGRIGGSFDRRGGTDSSAGRLIADAQLSATRAPERGGAQVALMNPGGIRADLACRGEPPCTVTYGDVFTMQPFGNSLVVMTLSGAEFKDLLEQQQGPRADRPNFLQPSAGLTYRWRAREPYGRRVQDLRLDGRPIAPDQRVRLTVNSFLAEGGDGQALLRRGHERLGGAQDLDALVAHLQSSPAPQAQPRIEWVD